MSDSDSRSNSARPTEANTIVQRFLDDNEGTEPDEEEEENIHPLHAAVLRALEDVGELDNKDELLFRSVAARFDEEDTDFSEQFIGTWIEYIEDEDDQFQSEFFARSLEIDLDSLLEAELSQKESDERLLDKLATRLEDADDNFLIALAEVIHEADVIFPDDDLLEEEAGQNLEMLAREMYTVLRQRLALERERQGSAYAGRLPW
ncbi:MAG: hypothetical protein HC838_04610 [Spirulinaceae cyanobacterium RM2_2_10]|nr:hypothetical protein [Spirulinaceae cyanobacterium SM2_1_0]NJO19476.1 hypothetical protein [Spirulinaceae cyanobacterium RM2_2_10]